MTKTRVPFKIKAVLKIFTGFFFLAFPLYGVEIPAPAPQTLFANAEEIGQFKSVLGELMERHTSSDLSWKNNEFRLDFPVKIRQELPNKIETTVLQFRIMGRREISGLALEGEAALKNTPTHLVLRHFSRSRQTTGTMAGSSFISMKSFLMAPDGSLIQAVERTRASGLFSARGVTRATMETLQRDPLLMNRFSQSLRAIVQTIASKLLK